MKRLLPLLTLLLVACTSSSVAHYTLTYDTQDPVSKSELATATARVIERRLLALEQQVNTGDVTVEGDVLSAKIAKKETAQKLTEQLARPFTMHVMLESDEASADVRHPQFGAFKETGIIENHFDRIDIRPSAAGEGKATAFMKLTPEGQTLLKKVVSENKGKVMGVFLRGILMSKKQIDQKEATDSIIIDGIPSTDTALVFADDVNVGLHVTFTEAK